MVHEHIEKMFGRREDSHKGDYGKVFVVAGSRGLTGAAFLTAQSALVSGSGLVTCGIPASLNTIMEIKLTEVMTLPLEETKSQALSLKAKDSILSFAERSDVVAIGPGLGRDNDTFKLVRELVQEICKPVVLDADGLNAFEGEFDILKDRQYRTIITPHPGEMARLTGRDIDSVQGDRVSAAKDLAERARIVVCLKGHHTVIADLDGNTYVNETGNSGMATGGTGDVLTGMIASFVGQKMEDFSAVVSAVYLHGLAGDIACEKKGAFSMTASDLIEYMHEAFNKAGI